MIRQYTLSFADSITHKPEHPDRTARRNGSGLNFDVTFQVWPNRAAMLKTIEMQQKRAPRSGDWRACQSEHAGCPQ